MAAGLQHRGTWQVLDNKPDLGTGIAANRDGWMWVAQTADPLVPEDVPAGVPGIGGRTVSQNDWIVWDAASRTYSVVPYAQAGVSTGCYNLCVAPTVTQLDWGWQVSTTP